MKKPISLIALAACTLIIGCTVPEVVQNPDGTSTTNQVVDPTVIAAVETAKAINAASAPVNPYSPLISGVLGTSTGIFAIWSTFATIFANRNKKMLVSTIQGVDKVGDKATKVAIQTAAENNGVQTDLHQVVKTVT